MKKHLFGLLISIYLLAAGWQPGWCATVYDTVEEALGLGLRVVEVITENGEEPSCDYVSHPEGSWGQSITNATKVPGAVRVYNLDGSVAFNSGDYVKGESGMTIKIRGNTSAYADKKPFKIKLQKKGDMLTRGDKNFNDKNWVLLSDPKMTTWLGFELSKLLGQEWTPAAEYVNVIVNGDYRGLYMLAEAVERNEKCRINVAEGGFVAQHDPYWWNEDGMYFPSVDLPEYGYTLKYPDFEDLTTQWSSFISECLTDYEESIFTGRYPAVIDMESFARWVLGNDILGTSDGGGVNLYLVKKDEDVWSPIYAGPLWDFDSAEGTSGKWSAVHRGRFAKLFNHTNQAFTHTYVKLWNKIGEDVFEGMQSVVDGLADACWKGYNASVKADNKRWNYYKYNATMVQSRVAPWFTQRRPWLRDNIAALAENSGASEVTEDAMPLRIEGHEIIVGVPSAMVEVYSLDGKNIAGGSFSAGDVITLPGKGVFIIKTGGRVMKVMVQ